MSGQNDAITSCFPHFGYVIVGVLIRNLPDKKMTLLNLSHDFLQLTVVSFRIISPSTSLIDIYSKVGVPEALICSGASRADLCKTGLSYL